MSEEQPKQDAPQPEGGLPKIENVQFEIVKPKKERQKSKKGGAKEAVAEEKRRVEAERRANAEKVADLIAREQQINNERARLKKAGSIDGLEGLDQEFRKIENELGPFSKKDTDAGEKLFRERRKLEKNGGNGGSAGEKQEKNGLKSGFEPQQQTEKAEPVQDIETTADDILNSMGLKTGPKSTLPSGHALPELVNELAPPISESDMRPTREIHPDAKHDEQALIEEERRIGAKPWTQKPEPLEAYLEADEEIGKFRPKDTMKAELQAKKWRVEEDIHKASNAMKAQIEDATVETQQPSAKKESPKMGARQVKDAPTNILVERESDVGEKQKGDQLEYTDKESPRKKRGSVYKGIGTRIKKVSGYDSKVSSRMKEVLNINAVDEIVGSKEKKPKKKKTPEEPRITDMPPPEPPPTPTELPPTSATAPTPDQLPQSGYVAATGNETSFGGRRPLPPPPVKQIPQEQLPPEPVATDVNVDALVATTGVKESEPQGQGALSSQDTTPPTAESATVDPNNTNDIDQILKSAESMIAAYTSGQSGSSQTPEAEPASPDNTNISGNVGAEEAVPQAPTGVFETQPEIARPELPVENSSPQTVDPGVNLDGGRASVGRGIEDGIFTIPEAQQVPETPQETSQITEIPSEAPERESMWAGFRRRTQGSAVGDVIDWAGSFFKKAQESNSLSEAIQNAGPELPVGSSSPQQETVAPTPSEDKIRRRRDEEFLDQRIRELNEAKFKQPSNIEQEVMSRASGLNTWEPLNVERPRETKPPSDRERLAQKIAEGMAKEQNEARPQAAAAEIPTGSSTPQAEAVPPIEVPTGSSLPPIPETIPPIPKPEVDLDALLETVEKNPELHKFLGRYAIPAENPEELKERIEAFRHLEEAQKEIVPIAHEIFGLVPQETIKKETGEYLRGQDHEYLREAYERSIAFRDAKTRFDAAKTAAAEAGNPDEIVAKKEKQYKLMKTVETAQKSVGLLGRTSFFLTGLFRTKEHKRQEDAREALRSANIKVGKKSLKDTLENVQIELRHTLAVLTNAENSDRFKRQVETEFKRWKRDLTLYAKEIEDTTNFAEKAVIAKLTELTKKDDVKNIAKAVELIHKIEAEEARGIVHYLDENKREEFEKKIETVMNAYITKEVGEAYKRIKLGNGVITKFKEALEKIIEKGSTVRNKEETAKSIVDELIVIGKSIPKDADGNQKRLVIDGVTWSLKKKYKLI